MGTTQGRLHSCCFEPHTAHMLASAYAMGLVTVSDLYSAEALLPQTPSLQSLAPHQIKCIVGMFGRFCIGAGTRSGVSHWQ